MIQQNYFQYLTKSLNLQQNRPFRVYSIVSYETFFLFFFHREIITTHTEALKIFVKKTNEISFNCLDIKLKFRIFADLHREFFWRLAGIYEC